MGLKTTLRTGYNNQRYRQTKQSDHKLRLDVQAKLAGNLNTNGVCVCECCVCVLRLRLQVAAAGGSYKSIEPTKNISRLLSVSATGSGLARHRLTRSMERMHKCLHNHFAVRNLDVT